MTREVLVAIPDARRLAERVLQAFGAPPEHACVQAAVLVAGEVRGHPSHGLLRLPRLVRRIRSGVLDPAAGGQLTWTHTGQLMVDGQRGFGAVVAERALDAVTDRARETGTAVALVRNSNHIGMLAHYAERVAAQGQVLIATTTSEALVHPWGGTTAMFGTNPLAIGVPTETTPLVLDMATGVVSMGKIHAYAAEGRPLQEGWAVDGQGRPTVVARAATSGAIAPFGGAKGYGLGIALEILVTALTGAALGLEVRGTLDDDQVCNKGDVFIVIETANSSAAAITSYLDAVRSSPRLDPAVPVVVPGDRSAERTASARGDGLLIPAALWAELESLANTNTHGGWVPL